MLATSPNPNRCALRGNTWARMDHPLACSLCAEQRDFFASLAALRQANEIAQCIKKALAAKPVNLSSILIVGECRLPQTVLWLPLIGHRTCACVHICICVYKNRKSLVRFKGKEYHIKNFHISEWGVVEYKTQYYSPGIACLRPWR